MTHLQPEKNNFKEIDVSNLDAITWLRTIESNSVDLVITDHTEFQEIVLAQYRHHPKYLVWLHIHLKALIQPKGLQMLF